MTKVYAMPLKGESGREVCSALISCGDTLIAVDCGHKGFLPIIEAAMSSLGFDAKNLTKLIITHQDQDHIGALPELTEKYPNTEILCSEEQSLYILGKSPSFRQIASNSAAGELKPLLAYPEKLKTVKAGDVICVTAEAYDEIEIIDTKGHLPGHISVYVKSQKTLITGDAMNVNNGVLVGANPAYTLDMEVAAQSIKNLLNYEIDRVICYHGGEFTGNVKQAIENI